jgi:MOB kinase activator 1
VEALMSWTQSILDDEKHFPQKIGKPANKRSTRLSVHLSQGKCVRKPRIAAEKACHDERTDGPGVRFPSSFMTTAKTILRRLFRVYAHIYHSHFDQICALGIEGELMCPNISLHPSLTLLPY